MERIKDFVHGDFTSHIKTGAIVRFLLVTYSLYHDALFTVPYTDIDYSVFIDAAKYVYDGNSPYSRTTYRYSPLIAYLVLPTIFLGENAGKTFFCIFDMLLAIASKNLIEYQLQGKSNASAIATYAALFWIYNPMSIAISTRGNADSIPGLLVILAIYFLQTNAVKGLMKYAISGFFLGLSIHLRLYPIVFSFPMYLSLGEYKINRETRILAGIASLMPNRKQLTLAISCILTLSIITLLMYSLYGFEFLFETYLYHLFRKDAKHNFSIAFYHTYLNLEPLAFDIIGSILLVIKVLLLLYISLTFGTKPETLPFALFCQSVILVTYNSVMTSQYFIWFLSLLPLVVHSFKMSILKALFLFVIWLAAQGAWLFSAYLLEFQNEQSFIYIWINSIVFFLVNVYILAQLIKSYVPKYGFGKTNDKEGAKND